MDLYRKTYVEINLKNIQNNVSKIINKYNNYKYYFGVVKADCYGHQSLETVKSIINGGCNYLAVATLEEALVIRKKIKEIPILCLGIIPIEFINICILNNITITISSLDYALSLSLIEVGNIKVHIKINTGMNRLGINCKNDFNSTINFLNKKNIFVEGIYTHIYDYKSDIKIENQFNDYFKIIEDIDKSKIPIFHISASETINYPKKDIINGCRIGIIMYGLTESNDSKLDSTFSLYSRVIQINNIKKGETVGYGGTYVANQNEKIGVVCIGYADGIIRKNTGRNVYINNKEYKIIGNICMDMLFIKIDDEVKLNDKVVIIKDNNHIKEIASYLNTIPYEVICSISNRVPRIYKK